MKLRKRIILGISIVVIAICVIPFAISQRASGGPHVLSATTHLNGADMNNLQTSEAPILLLNQTGHDSELIQAFTTKGDWNLSWSYDCSHFGHQGIFEIAIFYTDGGITSLTPVNQFGKQGTGEEHYQGNGSYYLAINSLCSWRVQVKE